MVVWEPSSSSSSSSSSMSSNLKFKVLTSLKPISVSPFYLFQTDSQVRPSTSFPGSPLSSRADPGWVWSRVSQNLGNLLNACLGRGVSVSPVIIARKGITTHLILWPDDCFRPVAGQNITMARGELRDQPQPGPLSSSTKRPWERGWFLLLGCFSSFPLPWERQPLE